MAASSLFCGVDDLVAAYTDLVDGTHAFVVACVNLVDRQTVEVIASGNEPLETVLADHCPEDSCRFILYDFRDPDSGIGCISMICW